MPSTINLTIFTLWLFGALVDYLEMAYYWQLKEYRWDRMKDFLATEQGKMILFQKRVIWRSGLVMMAFFLPFNTIIIKLALLAILFTDLLLICYQVFFQKNFRHPVFTKKAILIVLVVLCLEGGIFLRSHDWDILLLLLMVRLFLIGFVVYFFNILTAMIKADYLRKATRKMASYKKLTVIGITGSYGKTTTKIFLQHILSKKFKVISTPKHVNTEIGVAKFILENNFFDYNIFIVEMGAYNPGEIKAICNIVKPQIGILTAINEQHLSLFGNIRITQQAKYELLRALPKNGLAVVNSDNEYCREFLSELVCQVETFGIDKEFKPTLWVKELKVDREWEECIVVLKGQEIKSVSNLRGEHNVMNVMPCTLVASHLGMNSEEITDSIKDLPRIIEIIKYGTCEIINDSYNSNPVGFRAALNYLAKFPSDYKRIVITRGMLELGDKSEEIHEAVAGEIAYVADELVIITSDSETAMRRGGVQKFHLNIITKYSPLGLLDYVKSLKYTKSVILLENRIPEMVMKEIVKD